MSDKQIVRKMLKELDNFEEDYQEDYSRQTLRRMREPKDKFNRKTRREKPEWKRPDVEDDD